MQFVKNGPDVPESLLRDHEDGKVVFFCGAGISYPVGLPGFRGLVDRIYEALHERRTSAEDAAYAQCHFDRVLGQLESRFHHGRALVRRSLPEILRPASEESDTHRALLDLARCRDRQSVRIITTNFDLLFERQIGAGQRVTAYVAPLLPVPKPSRWNGIVYLHGRLPLDGERDGEVALDNLVLSSGDFGLAYLTEGWAARFVSEVFRSYSVCFVGYSLGDPVVRYIVDALAADQQRGEAPHRLYAFVEADEKANGAWEASGVEPIPYAETSATPHVALHETLQEWARTYKQGAFGKEAIVSRCAQFEPKGGMADNEFVGRMLWALSEQTGIPAKSFAEAEPAPPIGWLEPLTARREGGPLLGLFDLAGVKQPTAPTFYLLRWLCRHLDKPELLLWAVGCPRSVAGEFARLASEVLVHTRCEIGPIGTAWGLLLADRMGTGPDIAQMLRWQSGLRAEGPTLSNRVTLRGLLAPRLRLRPLPPYRVMDPDKELDGVADLFECEVVFSAHETPALFSSLLQSEPWRAALPALLPEFQVLVRDALDILRAIGQASEEDDGTYWSLPSIAEHPQNSGFHHWTWLIERLRDAWLATLERDPERARGIAEVWWTEPYPLYKRLGFFAVTRIVDPGDRWLDELLANDGHWLWERQVKRETIRALVELSPKLAPTQMYRLQDAILTGPPGRWFKREIGPEERSRVVDDLVWLRLAKLERAGVDLAQRARERLDQIRTTYPSWGLAHDERDEFSYWMTSFSAAAADLAAPSASMPTDATGLAEWLAGNPGGGEEFRRDEWPGVCRENPEGAAGALTIEADRGHWNAARWTEALQAWASDEIAARAWATALPSLRAIPKAVMQAVAKPLAWWLRSVAAVLDESDAVPGFVAVCQTVLALPLEEGQGDDPVARAMNATHGMLAEAVLRLWFRRKPQAGDLLPPDLQPLLSAMCDISRPELRDARVELAGEAIAFFRTDPGWFQKHLVPVLDWHTSSEAAAVWCGFVYTNQIYYPLLVAVGPAFLETARHYHDLAERWRERYAALLTYAALEPSRPFDVPELVEAFAALPADGRVESASVLVRALESAAGSHGDYWRERMRPLIREVWPQPTLPDPALAMQFVRLAIAAAKSEFADAIVTLGQWLGPVDEPWFAVHAVLESKLCESNPEDALELLSLTVGERCFPADELEECLRQISESVNVTDHRYIRLKQLARM